MSRKPRPYVLCLPADTPSEFMDNEYGVCVRCEAKVQHRPHIPEPNHLLCTDCFADIRAAAGGVFEVTITPETLRELYLATRKNGNK